MVRRRNRHGTPITPGSRPFLKRNPISDLYPPSFRNPNIAETVAGQKPPLGKLICILAVVMHGDKWPMEDGAYPARELLFRSAAHYCLSTRQIDHVMSYHERTRRQYMKGLLMSQHKVFIYDVPGDA